MEGNIGFYRHAGFGLASPLGLHYHTESSDAEVPYFLARELHPGYLKGIEGTYHPPRGYFVAKNDPKGFAAFDATFPAKEMSLQPGQHPQFCRHCGKPLHTNADCGIRPDGTICFALCRDCFADGRNPA